MAIKNIIAKGIGFSPSTISFIVTHGFNSGVVAFPLSRLLDNNLHKGLDRGLNTDGTD